MGMTQYPPTYEQHIRSGMSVGAQSGALIGIVTSGALMATGNLAAWAGVSLLTLPVAGAVLIGSGIAGALLFGAVGGMLNSTNYKSRFGGTVKEAKALTEEMAREEIEDIVPALSHPDITRGTSFADQVKKNASYVQSVSEKPAESGWFHGK